MSLPAPSPPTPDDRPVEGPEADPGHWQSGRSRTARYGLALAAAAVAVLLTQLLHPVVPQLTWLLVLSAVTVAAWFGGLGPGLLATVAGAVGILYFRLEPTGTLRIATTADALWLLSFVLVALISSLIVQGLHADRGQAAAAGERARRLAEQYRELADRLREHATQLEREVVERRQVERSLRRQAALLDLAYDAILVWKVGAEREIVFWNEGAAALYGYATEEAVGRASHALLRSAPADGTEDDMTAVEAALHRDGRWEGELHQTTRDGRRLVIESRQRLVRPPDGDPAEGTGPYVLEIDRDVTGRHEAAAALEASDQRYRQLVDAAPQLSWSDRADGTLEFLNARWCAYTGHDAAYVHHQRWLEAVHPDDRERVLALRARAIAAAESYEFEMRLRRHDGAYRWFAANVLPLRDARGRPTAWLGAALDVHERRRREAAEQVLAEAGRVLADSLEMGATLRAVARLAVPTLADYCVVDVVGDDGRLRRLAEAHVDPVHEAVLARTARYYPRAGGPAHPLQEVFVARETRLVATVDDAWLRTAAPTTEHMGDVLALAPRSLVVVPLVARGGALGVVTFVRSDARAGGSGLRYEDADVPLLEALARRAALAIDNARLYESAQRARAEAELAAARVREHAAALEGVNAQLQEQAIELEQQTEAAQALAAELEATTEELRSAVTVAEAANRAKSDFLATMSHEIRTPINAILGFNELLELGIAGPLTADQRNYLERVRTSGRHLLGIVNELLDLATVEAGRMVVRRRPGRLRAAVEPAVDLLRAQAAARSLTLVVECADDATYVGDEDRVRQIVVNLLANAVKFTEPHGRITVSCGSETIDGRRHALVHVADTGIGIAREQLETIFEPFVQVERGYTRTRGGAGLGLAISRRLATVMGGELLAVSAPGQGSRFTLRLATPESVAAEARVLRPRTAEPSPALVGELLTAGTVTSIVRVVADRLRADPATAIARELGDAIIEDHLGTIIRDIGALLVYTQDAETDPVGTAELIADGSEIQRVIAERHGAQRARHGWTEAALTRELQIVEQEVTAAVRRVAPPEAGRAVEQSVTVLRRFLDRAAAISVEGFRRALARAEDDRAGTSDRRDGDAAARAADVEG